MNKDAQTLLNEAIKRKIETLQTILQWTQESLEDDEPLEVEMKWLCAKGIIPSINALIEKYVEEVEE